MGQSPLLFSLQIKRKNLKTINQLKESLSCRRPGQGRQWTLDDSNNRHGRRPATHSHPIFGNLELNIEMSRSRSPHAEAAIYPERCGYNNANNLQTSSVNNNYCTVGANNSWHSKQFLGIFNFLPMMHQLSKFQYPSSKVDPQESRNIALLVYHWLKNSQKLEWHELLRQLYFVVFSFDINILSSFQAPLKLFQEVLIELEQKFPNCLDF